VKASNRLLRAAVEQSALAEMHQGAPTNRRWSFAILALACVVGAAFVLGATTRGVGLTPDSTQYLAVANSATQGHGLVTFAWDAEPMRLTHFPPGYPLVLAAAARTGWSPAGFARWFNAALFAVTIVLAALMTRRLAPGSFWAPLAVAALIAVANDLVEAHSMVWTEPLYLTLTLVGLLTLAVAIERQSIALLGVAAGLAGCSAIMRYIGVANMVVVSLAALLWWPASWWRRVWTAAAMSLVAAIPLAVLTLSGGGTDAATGSRQIAWHPIDTVDLRSLASVVVKWVTPWSDATFLTLVWLVVVAVLAGSLFVLRRRAARSQATAATASPVLARTLFLYVAVYGVVLSLAMSLADAQTELDARLLAPIQPIVVMLGVAWLTWPRSPGRGVRLATAALFALVFGAELSRVVSWTRTARSEGIGLRRLAGHDSAIVAATSRLPASALVYSNRPYFLRVQTSRMVPGLPRQRDPNSLLPNPRYAEQLRAMCDTAALRETYVVWFPEDESEDASANRYPTVGVGEVTSLPGWRGQGGGGEGGRVLKVGPGCRV